MTEPVPKLNQDANIDDVALQLGRDILGRALDADEADALQSILRAAAQALKHGFIRRLAEHVRSESETESVEEFFGDNLRTS